ncbi:hypothetical protein BDV41DRAFT_520618 [Aspergillus transmontanensis]|uniref:Uncharacterized protein n=1 Tax=Aspergillus transmontanensis TaxID=1034304 RepID=A0A5N6WGQ9_9EURO|nr:hypothetical protein BDV41DRAFT_520618 [Aspergillus transmontanensis]
MDRVFALPYIIEAPSHTLVNRDARLIMPLSVSKTPVFCCIVIYIFYTYPRRLLPGELIKTILQYPSWHNRRY